MKLDFVGAAYTGRSRNLNAQRCVNLYPEIDPANGKNVMALYGTPGLSLFVYLGTAPMRGMHTLKDVIYGVSGSKLYKILANGTASELGTLLSSSGRVSMADNGTQIMIVDGDYGYIYNINTGGFAQVVDADFPGADVVTFMDGYFIFNKPGTGSYMITSLYDGTAVDALDIKTAERDPDLLISLINDHGELWLFGEYTTEVHYNSGAASFPFERMNGVVIEEGIVARWSVVKFDNSTMWLAQNKQGKGYVVRANGYTPQVVSTRAIEYQISTYPTISDAYAYSYTEEGHRFYVLTFPTGNATWVYDATTGLWHERSSYGVGRHRAGSYVFFNGKHYVGDYLDGDIYEMSLDYLDDRGDPIERIRAGQYIHNRMKPLFVHRLAVDMETGVGTTGAVVSATYIADGTYAAGGQITAAGVINSTLSGADPKAMLRWSDDGGHTWSNEHWAGIGKMGEYKKQVIWNRLGYTNNSRAFELKITDPVKVAILDANIELTAGR